MTIATCPPPVQLERLFLGGLPEQDLANLEQHVLQCAPCRQKVDQLLRNKDSIARALTAAGADEGLASSRAVVDLVRKLKSLQSAGFRGASMLTISCPSCHKRLSVKDELVGKKVKCPGCGQLTVVAQPAALAAGREERTIPPTSLPDGPESPTIAPLPPQPSDAPTNPPLDRAEHTLSGKRTIVGADAKLIDFLAPPQAPDELGRLGKYRILKILGHGGMGVVYKAEDPKLKRTVAIKAMLPTLAASASCGERFMREAEAMAAVEHDHIVRIYQIDEERGVPFMAMEFLKGEPLDERLKRGEPFALSEIARIGREIAEGLDAAHSKGLIHRDIKPGNIWLERKDEGGRMKDEKATHGSSFILHRSSFRVKILDFGLARAASQEAGLTQQGAIIGTPAYMAPEQGRGAEVDARCDLFSLGVVLYQLCTGKPPFRGNDTVSTLMEVAMHNPEAPIMINSELPQVLSDLVMKLLEKDPERRVETAAAVIEALHKVEKELALKETPPTVKETPPTPRGEVLRTPRVEPSDSAASTRGVRSTSRRGVGILLAASLFAVLAAAGIIFYWPTSDGVVRIEVNDPDIQVVFDKDGPTIKGSDKEPIKLAAGPHGLRIKRGDLEFETDKFILRKGDTVTLKIEWFEEGKLQVKQGDKVIGEMAVAKAKGPPVQPLDKGVGGTENPEQRPDSFALQFDGKGKVDVPTLRFTSQRQLTLEALALLDAAPNNLISEAIIAGVPVQMHLFANTIDKTVGAHTYGSGKNLEAPWPETRRWVHVAAVRDGGKTYLFVDGKKRGELKHNDVPPANSKNFFQIGQLSFMGQVREVRVSKSARYDSDFTPAKRFEPDAATLALYHCDEGKGDVLTDSSGRGHHGKIVGAKWVKADGSPSVDPATPLVKGQPKLLYTIQSFGAVRWLHQAPLYGYHVAFSGDGNFLVLMGRPKEKDPDRIKVYDFHRPTAIKELSHWAPKGGVPGVAEFAPESDFMAIAASKELTLWQWPAKKLETVPLAENLPRALAFSPDGRWLVWGDHTAEEKMPAATLHWRDRQRPEAKFEPITVGKHHVNAAVFSADSRYLAVMPQLGRLQVFDASNRQLLFEGPGKVSNGFSVAFTHKGNLVAAGAQPGSKTFHALSVPDGKPLAELAMPAAGRVGPFLDNDRLATWADYAGNVSFIDTTTWQVVSTFKAHDVPFHLAGSPDGTLLATLGIDGMVKIWDLREGASPITPPAGAVDLLKLIDAPKNSIKGAFTFQGQTLITPATADNFKPSALQIPFVPPPAYELELVVKRRSAVGWQSLVVGLIVGGNRCTATLDVSPGPRSGLQLVDGKDYWREPLAVLPVDKPSQLIFRVTPGSIFIYLEGKELLAWKGDARSLTTDERWDMPNPRELFIGTIGTGNGFHISKLELRPLPGPSGPTTPPSRGPLTASIVRKFEGHTGKVHGLAISRDGKYVVTGSLDDSVILWDTASGKKLRTFEKTGSVVINVDVSDDGKIVATGNQAEVVVWDAVTGKKIKTFGPPPGNPNLCRLALSRDGKLLLIGSEDGKAYLWEAATAKPIRTFDAGGVVWRPALSDNGKRVLTYSQKGKVNLTMLWDVAGKEPLRTWQKQRGIALSGDGKLVLTQGRIRESATLWDGLTGQKLFDLTGHNVPIEDGALSGDGRFALTGSYGKTAILWDTASGKKLQDLEGHTDWVLRVALSGDGTYALTGSDDKTAILWEIKPASPAAELSPLDRLDPKNIPAAERFPWQPKELVAVLGKHQQKEWGWGFTSVSGDGTLVSTSQFGPFRPKTKEILHIAGYPLKIWDASTMMLRAEYSPIPDSPVPVKSESLVLIDAETGKVVRTLAKDAGTFRSSAFSEDGNLLLTGGSWRDDRLRLWQVEDGKEIWSNKLEGLVQTVALSRDARFAISCVNGQKIVRLWDAKTGKELRAFAEAPAAIGCSAFSPDASQAVGADLHGQLIFWEVATGKKMAQVSAYGSFINSVCYSRDGRHVLTGSADTWAAIHEVAGGKRVFFVAHRPGWGAIVSASYSADEKRVITCDDHGWVRVWDVASGKQVHRTEGPDGAVAAIAFSADGSRLYTAGPFQATCWNAATGTAQKVMPTERIAAFYPEQQQALTGYADLQLLDMETGKEIRRSEPLKSQWGWGSLQFLAGGQRALSSNDGVLRLWDLATMKETQVFKGDARGILSGDVRHALTSRTGKDFSVGLWEVESDKQLRRFEGHTDAIGALAFAPDGKQAATAGKDKTIRIWDLFGPAAEPKLVLKEHTSEVLSVAYAPDGKSLLSAGSNGQLIWFDLPSGKKRREWQFPGPIHRVAFAPDGRHIVTGNANGTAYVLRLEAADSSVMPPELVAPPVSPNSYTNALGMHFALVPRGKTWLNGKEVNMSHDFYLGVHEVTQGEWEKLMGKNPSTFSRQGKGKDAVKDVSDEDLKNFPVENVSWEDCQEFLKKLNEQAKEQGWIYRLPTELQWEYACRGGPMTSKEEGEYDHFLAAPPKGLGGKANLTGKRPVKVGTYQPNRLGLFDMYGNVWEWCHLDGYPGTQKPTRGGAYYTTLNWISRRGIQPGDRQDGLGLRVARIPLAALPIPASWFKEAGGTKAEEQLAMVKAKLMERNPDFNGKFESYKIDGAGALTELEFFTDHVTDISPLKALAGLRTLTLWGSHPHWQDRNGKLADLSPLAGMNLTSLELRGTQVSDLAPLKGMKLTELGFSGTAVADLTPLRGMPLEKLYYDPNPKRDADLLRSIKTLKMINNVPADKVLSGLVSSAAPPLDPAWLKEVSRMTAAKQIEAVKAELMERNKGWSGTWKPVVNQAGAVTEIQLSADNVEDLSPLRAFPALWSLSCGGTNGSGGPRGKLADLAPLQGMKLTHLWIPNNKLLSDLTPLKDMKLNYFVAYHTSIADLAPLAGMKLTLLDCGFSRVTNVTPLTGMPLTSLLIDGTDFADLALLKDMPLTELSCIGIHDGGAQGKIASLAPLQGMKLTHLRIANQPQIRDLTPLKGMPLTQLFFYHTAVDNLAPLVGMPLTELNCGYTKVAGLTLLKDMPLKTLWCDYRAERDAAILRSIKTLEKINDKSAKLVLK